MPVLDLIQETLNVVYFSQLLINIVGLSWQDLNLQSSDPVSDALPLGHMTLNAYVQMTEIYHIKSLLDYSNLQLTKQIIHLIKTIFLKAEIEESKIADNLMFAWTRNTITKV